MTKKKQKKRLNFHPLLRDYHDRAEYPQIASAVAQALFEGAISTEEEIIPWVAARYGAIAPRAGMRAKTAPLSIFGALGEQIPHNAAEQMYTVMRLPVALRGALMPDAHHGYAMPIGGVAVLDRAVSPSFVGYDISCMMHLSLFELPPGDFLQERERLAQLLAQETSFGLGAAFDTPRDHAVMEAPGWREIAPLRKLREKAQAQLGSSGGGNHFANLMLIEFHEAVEGLEAGRPYVALLTHSGSRGTGHKVATHYVKLAEREIGSVARGIPKGYEWLSIESEAGQEYLAAMARLGEYALANHQLIHHHFARAAGLERRFQLWNRHNYAWVDPSSGEVVHRKGATPAETGVLGIIPGTSGTASYVVEGLGNEASIFSSSHGAGRFYSRTEAKRRHDDEAFTRHMAERDILHRGLAPDESYQAYKDIEMVMALQEGLLVRRVATLTPKVVLMGGVSDDGD